ncbi:MAG: AAA family ATPase [Paracoccaceae bacterium]|nr:AAA family ATPase [Paracoccaceae bacterium]
MNMQRSVEGALTDRALPGWLQEFCTGMSVRPQFVVSGNIRDVFPVQFGGKLNFLGFDEALWTVLHERGYVALLRHDPIEGIRIHPGADPAVKETLRAAGIELDSDPRDLKALAETLGRVTRATDLPIAMLVDYVSQLIGPAQALDLPARDFFVACDKLAHGAEPLRAPGRPPYLSFNPIVWRVNRPHELPDWYTVSNEAIRPLVANLPDLEERHAMAQAVLPAFPDAAELGMGERNRALEQFTLETDGMTLRSMRAIVEFALVEGIGLRHISDAIRAYRIGTRRNPWKAAVMRGRIEDAERRLTDRVKGQSHAVSKALDILVRTVMGLSGAQSSSRHARPRGVLFFAGPTGVGKTELAKAITELLFGDETAYHRFDMSEFTSENSESRLVGAPPGYAGHEEGGELVNAARARPFSVFLFDEIEKAHPRILDKFLQIIDEGRLTDGRGETVHFSESLIIFTSNIGIFGDDRQMNMSLNILPSDTYGEIEMKIVKAIREYFRFTLRRPELINRIGQNIVVFEFIRSDSAHEILSQMVQKILSAVYEDHGIEIEVLDHAMATIEELCTADLFDGGRGIGNRLESVFVNPLARVLFQRAPEPGKVTVVGVEGQGSDYHLLTVDA